MCDTQRESTSMHNKRIKKCKARTAVRSIGPQTKSVTTCQCPQAKEDTVPFNSVRQSRITGPSKSLKCHVGHGNFCEVPNSFGDQVPNIENFVACGAKLPNIFYKSRQVWAVAETKISASPSRVTGPAELNEIAQYCKVLRNGALHRVPDS